MLHCYDIIKIESTCLFRKLPEGASNLRYIDYHVLSKKTQENLEILENKFGLYWRYFMMYDIKSRHGYIIKGSANKVNYPASKECWASGQTGAGVHQT